MHQGWLRGPELGLVRPRYGAGYASRNSFGLHNCTLYAAWRLEQNGLADPRWNDNANGWADQAAQRSVVVDQSPAVGAIAQWNGGGAGHVAYIEAVTADYIETSADNYQTTSASFHPGGWTDGYRIARSSPAFPDNIIHFKDQAGGGGTAGRPIGSLDGAAGGVPGFVQVRGWVLDPDAPTTGTSVHVYADGPAGTGTFIGAIDASRSRPDVASAHPAAGPDHGFGGALGGIAPGSHTIYVYGINVGGTNGDNPLLGSTTVSVPRGGSWLALRQLRLG